MKNKKELLRHIEILKTVPKIKSNIEELKFGCIYLKDNKYYKIKTSSTDTEEWSIDFRTWSKGPYKELRIGSWHIYNRDKKGYFVWAEKHGTRNLDRYYIKFEIIGQAHEGHLRMLFDKYADNYEFSPCPKIFSDGCLDFDELGPIPAKLDNTKPYMEQPEKFFKKLNNWIVKEFNIKL